LYFDCKYGVHQWSNRQGFTLSIAAVPIFTEDIRL
jgi:hypothetical protein